MTVAAAVACFFLLGTPKEVRWLSLEEKKMANARIVLNKVSFFFVHTFGPQSISH